MSEREEDEIQEIMSLPPLQESGEEKRGPYTPHSFGVAHKHMDHKLHHIERRTRSRNTRLVAHTLVIAAILIGALSVAHFSPTGLLADSSGDALSEIKAQPEVAPYAEQPVDLVQLSAGVLEQLRAEAPAVYGDVPAGAWLAVFRGDATDFLVIYDASAKQVLKAFEVTTVTIG